MQDEKAKVMRTSYGAFLAIAKRKRNESKRMGPLEETSISA